MNKWHVVAGVLAIALAWSGPAVRPARAEGQPSIGELFESSFALEATGQLGRALDDVKAILAREPRNYVANLRAGWLLYSLGRYAEAVRFYRKAIELHPKAIEPHLGVMLPLMAAKRWKEAEREANDILAKAPHNYLARSRLAWIHYSQGHYAAAEKAYRAVLDDFPSDVQMMLGLAWTWLKQGRKGPAREMFERVLTIRRKNESARAGLRELGAAR